MPTLVLLRHAKSDWPANTPDLSRALSPRGQRDCVAVAAAFEAHQIVVDHALVSPAVRTQETFGLVFDSLAQTPTHVQEPRIYEAHVSELFTVISEQTADSVLLVGHSPGMPHLALSLCNDIEGNYAKNIRHKYPTAGVTVLYSELPWAQWHSGCAELKLFEVPRADPHDKDSD